MIPKVIGIHKLAELLDCSPASIYSHIARKNWDAIPIPIRMGRRLAWMQTTVDEWFAAKTNFAELELKAEALAHHCPRRTGRPTKVEARAKNNA
ncbi:hypothetical protein LJB99_01215 [Deltaproteobacteria bacterium OttesenSCG-928-K17]|nr:hypothetical protein [Deltaproteobacteria bacterium OttesenSCG-928-K17]